MKNFILLKMAIILILVGSMLEPVKGQGLGSSCAFDIRNPAEVYCVQQGGCPEGGYCYFPDGSFCELWSFYNGTCPSREYYEQMLWEAEAYRFLYGDIYSPYGYYSSRPYYYPYNYPYYYPYYYPYFYPHAYYF